MFMHIVTQLSGRITALYTHLWALVVTRLWPSVKRLHVSFIQGFQSVVSLWFQVVMTLLKLKALLASLITAVQSIKAALKHAVTISGRIGSQLQTTVRLTLQRVMQLWKKGK